MRVKTEAKKKQITTAAQECFLGGGYNDCSMGRIAKRADVSKQTLYSYYATKEALFVDVVMKVVRGALDLGFYVDQAVNNEDDFRGQLKAIATALVEILMQNDYLALLRIVIAEAPRQPILVAEFRKHIPEQALQAFATMLQNAQSKDLIKISSPALTARMLLGGLITYVILEGLLAGGDTMPSNVHKEVGEFVDEFLDNISRARINVGREDVS